MIAKSRLANSQHAKYTEYIKYRCTCRDVYSIRTGLQLPNRRTMQPCINDFIHIQCISHLPRWECIYEGFIKLLPYRVETRKSRLLSHGVYVENMCEIRTNRSNSELHERYTLEYMHILIGLCGISSFFLKKITGKK